jgi:hypothetical protein
LSEFSWPINFKSEKKMLKIHENVAQRVLLDNAVLTALMSGRKYDVILLKGDCSRESSRRTSVFRNKVRYKNATPVQNSVRELSTFR